MSAQSSPAEQPPGAPHPRFPSLFSPLRIGPITAKNRIVNSAHATGFAVGGLYSDQLIAYHRERARGGAAIIVSQATSVDPDFGNLQNVDDRIIPWYERLMEAVRPHGARYFAELAHSGRQGAYYGRGPSLFHAPSAVPGQPYGGRWRIPHELEPAKIKEIIAAHAAAARRCRLGGIDGIELHFAHGNLVNQFISPLTNRRTDEWGGSTENRLRFAREVLEAIRSEVGRDLVVGCRFNGAELDVGGLKELELLEVVGLLDELELLDYFSISMGNYSDALNAARNMPPMNFPPGTWGKYGAAIKDVARVPVFLVGRVNHPDLAERMLSAGQCDMVVMARALIADPYLPLKAFEQRVEDIRCCVGAQDGCWGRYEVGRPISCVQNPTVGLEQEWGGELPPAEARKRVVVVGGGPAGLECARVAAARGHAVTLFERSQRLGGQILTAARAPQREELGQIVEWVVGQGRKLGVDFRLGAEADPEAIAALEPDAVAIATGARPGTLDPALGDFEQVVDAWALLDGRAGSIGRRVLVFDQVGTRPGFGAAELLAGRGHQVELVTPMIYPGQGIESTGWRMSYQRLIDLKVRFRPLSTVVGLNGRQVRVRHVYSGDEETLDGFDTLVTALLPTADDALYRALRDCRAEVHLIGDAQAPRGIEEAFHEGQRLGRRL